MKECGTPPKDQMFELQAEIKEKNSKSNGTD